MKHFITQFTNYTARFIQVQLFLSIVSLPILVSWGLPLSTMTAVGNFLFSPFLGTFLLCSSLIFFTELLGIPNSALIFLLDKITTLWSYCLSWGSKGWLIGFYKPSILILIAITVLAFAIMHHKKLGRLYPSIFCLSLLLGATTCYLKFNCPHETLFHIDCGKNKVLILIKNKKVIIKDQGAFAKKLSPDSWVQFTLLPELMQKTGRTTIDQIIVERPNTLTFEALSSLCQHTQVTLIELPYFSTELTKAGWRAFFELKRMIKQEDTTLKRTHLQSSQ